MNNKSWEEEFEVILVGIDKDEVESDSGWWETSIGAEFGINKKKELKQFISQTIKKELTKAVEKCLPSKLEEKISLLKGFNGCRKLTYSNFQQYIKKIK